MINRRRFLLNGWIMESFAQISAWSILWCFWRQFARRLLPTKRKSSQAQKRWVQQQAILFKFDQLLDNFWTTKRFNSKRQDELSQSPGTPAVQQDFFSRGKHHHPLKHSPKNIASFFPITTIHPYVCCSHLQRQNLQVELRRAYRNAARCGTRR